MILFIESGGGSFVFWTTSCHRCRPRVRPHVQVLAVGRISFVLAGYVYFSAIFFSRVDHVSSEVSSTSPWVVGRNRIRLRLLAATIYLLHPGDLAPRETDITCSPWTTSRSLSVNNTTQDVLFSYIYLQTTSSSHTIHWWGTSSLHVSL